MNESFDIYDFNYGTNSGNLLELKKWVDEQVSKGITKVDLEINWGYYNDIDGLTLNPVK